MLYVDLPNGQVSFHCPARLGGPNYPGEWDGQRASESKVIEFTDHVIEKARTEEHAHGGMQDDVPRPENSARPN